MLSLILKQKRSRVTSVEKKRRGYGTCQDVKRPIELKNCVVAVILYVNSDHRKHSFACTRRREVCKRRETGHGKSEVI